MVYIAKGAAKFIVANVTLIFVIMLLPVFLVTDNVPFFDWIMDFLFNNNKN